MNNAVQVRTSSDDLCRDNAPAGNSPDTLTNQAFIDAIFSPLPPGATVWACSFPGDPKESRQWGGMPGQAQRLPPLDPSHNTFFNTSSVRAIDGAQGRTSEHFAALHVVVLDDVGTKATLPCDALPTYLLETSAGNFQAGFLLDPPCEDLDAARRFLAAAAVQGVTDAGAQGPQSRYARLPNGVNHKQKCGPGGFRHRLHQWEPQRAYSLAALAEALGISIETVVKARARKLDRPQTPSSTEDAALISDILQSRKTRLVWEGESNDAGLGFSSGSDADQYLLNRIAFRTNDPTQIDRIYTASPRSRRTSSDGTQKWQQRPDYRERSIASALAFVEKHPNGDTTEAAHAIQTALAAATINDDLRPLYAPEALTAFAALKKGDPGAYDFFRKAARKAGASLATLDQAVAGAADAGRVLDADAAEMAIQRLGGRDGLIFSGGWYWHWRPERGNWWRVESEETIKQEIHAVLPRHQISAGAVGSVLSVLRTMVARPADFDRETGLVINCANGTLRLGSDGSNPWQLSPHRREDMHTMCVPVAWNPRAQCPAFLRFLNDITEGDSDAEEKKRLLVQAIGYSLTTDTREEVFFILHGPSSSNGKSTLLAVIAALAGKHNTSALSLQQLGERFSKATLFGKLVNLCVEIPRGAALPEDDIKKLTSGDLITAEFKGRDHFEFRPRATLWFATNTLPNLRDLSPATLEKRVRLIELNRSFVGVRRDTSLMRKLEAELEGIFFHCVTATGIGIQRARAARDMAAAPIGAEAGVRMLDGFLQDPPSSAAAKAAWRRSADPVQQFVEETIIRSTGAFVSSKELFVVWRHWSEANGVQLKLTQQQLTNRLKVVMPWIETGDGARTGRERGVIGIEVRPDAY